MVREDKKRKTAILGWYGHHNIGDETILMGVRNLFQDWKIIPMSSTKTSTVMDVNIKEINKCDLFVLGGGELINSNRVFIHTPYFCGVRIPCLAHKFMNRTKINNISWVHKIKIPKVILGCGVNVETVSELKKEVVSELEQFNYIGLRDQASVALLRSISTLKNKVHLFYDLALSLSCNPTIRPQNYKKTAVVIPTDRFTFSDKGVKQNQVALKSRDWLKQKLVGFDKTVFLPFGREDNNDYVTCQSLSECAKNSEIISPENLNFQTIIDYIANSEMVFTYRLHGMILSFILGKRFEYYPYHWKLKRVYETIKALSPDEIRHKQQKEFERMLSYIKNI